MKNQVQNNGNMLCLSLGSMFSLSNDYRRILYDGKVCLLENYIMRNDNNTNKNNKFVSSGFQIVCYYSVFFFCIIFSNSNYSRDPIA